MVYVEAMIKTDAWLVHH